ncbi:nuclear transport factor 2 family protein [Mucilaginibacter aquaedulcis]|uniref:nuclear transport factor 2 family protein n=1 Tax=Mucilaginibacter aquaedulcis TaxID=1187081 RepID=UPI0025B4275F|nr:hypothetical protein [Mucilaginibacter aquaedulcis]MDN3548856.1 hypothetical protein [Mucilaginibacter aquaedulcis]
MSNIVNNYAAAIAAGDFENIAATLSPEIKLLPPGANQPNEGKGKNSMMLSAVAAAVDGFKFVRSYQGSDNWHAILLEGSIEGTPVQFIDQVHVDENDLVDHVDIFLRPAGMAATLLGKVTEEIKKRTSA